MKIIKTIDFKLLLIVVAIGTIYEIYPPAIPDWLFNTMWIVGIITLIVFGTVYYIEKKQSK